MFWPCFGRGSSIFEAGLLPLKVFLPSLPLGGLHDNEITLKHRDSSHNRCWPRPPEYATINQTCLYSARFKLIQNRFLVPRGQFRDALTFS